jgi:hypothetical protein
MEHDDLYPIHVTVPGSPDDPRCVPQHEGIIVHYAPPPHPEETVELPGGLRVTSPAKTLVDLASDMDRDELRATFERAREIGLLDMPAVHRSRARLEWLPSNEMLDSVIAEFSS